MEHPNILEVNHLTVHFKSVHALDDVSLKVRAGEIHAVLGENGAGKTTLMKVLGGLYPAGHYSGEIVVSGTPVVLRKPSDAVRRGIAMVQRRPNIFGNLSVADNLVMGHWDTRGGLLLDRKADRRQAEETLRWLNVSLELDERAENLDGSQKRMLALARALASRPQLLVLDEPAAHVSGAFELSRLITIIRRLSAQNVACLYLTRTLEEATHVADRVSVLRDGQLAGSWERLSFDPAAMASATISQHPEREAFDDDEGPEVGGILGSTLQGLRNLFGGFSRR